jgi:hypothetical protein
MPVTCEIDPAAGLVYTTARGLVKIDEVVQALEAVMAHPDFRPRLNGIADFRAGDVEHIRSDDVRRLASLLARHRDAIGPSRTAVVVSRDVTFGMARMFQAFAEATPVETQVFRNMDEARQWVMAQS